MENRNRLSYAVIACHFASSIGALGMLPFLPLILEDSFHRAPGPWESVLYVTPTLFSLLLAPAWGALADAHGTKALLLRAQLGLAASFLLAGFAGSPAALAVALAAQGALGGTYAASRAYLAAALPREGLARSLTWMEASPKAALFAAPFLCGLGIQALGSPLTLYRWLALLPLLAAAVTWGLPAGAPPAPKTRALARGPILPELLGAYAALGLGAALVSAHFVRFALERYPTLTPAGAGLLLGLPSLVYLLFAPRLVNLIAPRRARTVLAASLLALSVAYYAHSLVASVALLAALRVALGVATMLCLLAAHRLLAESVARGREGTAFGWLDSAAKLGTIAGGCLGGMIAAQGPSAALFQLAALSALAMALFALGSAQADSRQEMEGRWIGSS